MRRPIGCLALLYALAPGPARGDEARLAKQRVAPAFEEGRKALAEEK